MYIYRYINAGLFSETEYEACLRLLSEEKLNRIGRLGSFMSRKLTAAGDMLARSLAAEVTGTGPNCLTVAYGDNGKPYVINNPAHISISHSGVYALAAASLKPVGADIEKIRAVKPNVAKRFCSAVEFKYLQSDENCFDRRAVELWTMKEAYGKLLGTGVFAPGRFTADIINGCIALNYSGFRFEFPETPEGYIICLCESTEVKLE